MSKKLTFAIMGATGHIGRNLTEELLKRGHKVHALGRDIHKLGELKAKGAEIFSGNFTDNSFLTKGFKGCQAVFSFLPPGYTADDMEVLREKTSEAIVQALAHTKITHVLNLSSIGGNLLSGAGPINELHRQEERLNLMPNMNVLHFRPSFFMENFEAFLPGIKSSGVMASALKADLAIPMVATQDIALKIADLLEDLKFTGSSVFEFTGPEEVTMEEAAKIIGKAMGKPDLKYKHLYYEQAEEAMISSGMKHQLAKLMLEMYRGFNEGIIMPTQKLTAAHKGKTTLKEFAKTLAHSDRTRKKAA